METSKRRKVLIVGISLCIVVILYLAWTSKGLFYPESLARRVARSRLDSFLRQTGQDPGKLDTGHTVPMTGVAWAFEWKYLGDPPSSYRVYILRDGSPEMSGGDDGE